MKRPLLILTVAATLAISAFALQRTVTAIRTARTAAAAPQSLATLLPQGALLTISSPDFATLLHAWTSSPQSTAWLQSASYSVFQNSRLFSRLSDAQTEFASTAKLSEAGSDFLTSIAGRQSIFAWYDVGNLEFLYITRLPAARAAQTQLLQQRTRFSRRQVGTQVFYVRTEASADGPKRTVAFATSGDLLLLATREDLIANALQLIAHTTPPSASLAQEPWYDEASAAQPAATHGPNQEPDLHMVLNLDRLVPLPYFRSYWVQANISEMKQYRTAVSDLFREPTQFREERTLLYKAPPDSSQPDPDLAPLAALVPPETGVFRAVATTDPQTALSALNEKLLGRVSLPKPADTSAPDANLDVNPEGSTEDLETRIDTPAPLPESASATALTQTLQSAGLEAVLTLDSAPSAPTAAPQPLWIPIHSAVVLRTARPIPQSSLTSALQQALRGSLTAANLGIELRPTQQNPAILTLSGPKPLFLALSGNLCLLSNDQPLLAALLTRIPASAQAAATPATYLAAFNHTAQRAPYRRLTSLIDATAPTTPDDPDTPPTPQFFSGNIRSLSDAFAALQSQHILTRHQGETLHQTVTYVWSKQPQ